MVLARQATRLGVNRVAVSPTIYRLSWWLIFSVHLINGVLVLVTGSIYLFFSRDATFSNVSLLQIPQSTLQLSGWSYLVLASVHAYAFSGLITRSVRAGQLTLRRATPPTHKDKNRQVPPLGAVANKRHWMDPRTWRAAIKHRYSSSFGMDGSLGINGVHFYRWFVVREAIEVGLQTYQANQLSRSVARTSINLLAAGAIIFNCISTPIVFFVFRKQEMVRRLVSLLVDMVLDFMSSTVLPLAVVYPYIAAYNTSTGTLPIELYLNDAWLIGALEVIRQSAVTSLVDYFASLLPHVSVISCLSIAKSVIRRDVKADHRLFMQLISTTAASQASFPVVAVATNRPCSALHSILSLAWAGFVLVAHLNSQFHTSQPMMDEACRLPMKPWFTDQAACAVIQLNCYRDGTTGRSDEITARLSSFDRSMVKKIIISHCTALEMPPVLQEFRELTNIAVFNVTFRSWSTEAAITGETNPRLSTIDLHEARIDCPLEGIYHEDMPSSFSFFTVARTNLTGFPDNIGILWKRLNLQVFNAQFTNLRRLPSSFSRLRIKRLRLISNALENVNELNIATQPQQLVVLHLSGSPLNSLPNSIGDVSKLRELLVEDTLVTTVPDQITAWLQSKPNKVSFSGSPLCNSSSLAAKTTTQLCGTRFGYALATLGWDQITAQRPL